MPEQRQKRKAGRRISVILRSGVAIVACALIFRQLDSGQLVQSFRQVRISTGIIAILAFTAAQVFIALRWWLLLRAQEIRLGLWIAIKLNFLGLFFNNFLPGSVGGDFVRAWYAAQHTSKKLPAAISVFVDRIVGLMVTLILAVGAYLMFVRSMPILAVERRRGLFDVVCQNRGLVLALAASAVLLTAILLMIPSVRAGLRNLYGRLAMHGTRGLKMLIETFFVFCRKPGLLPATAGLTFIFQACVLLAFWRFGKDLQIDASLRYYFVFFPLVWVVGSLPLSLAGIGILEGGLIILFTRYAGTSTEAAAALALGQRVVWIAASLPGLVIHLFGRHLPKPQGDFFVDAPAQDC